MVEAKSYTCFFIAQMKTPEELERMYRVVTELLKPILEPLGYTIITPDEPTGSASIFDFIMKMLDTADLLVADLTGDNPNVYYELSIRHSLGLPFALISQHNPRFDIADLRYIPYDPNDLNHPRLVRALTDNLKDRHRTVMNKGDVKNPITDFYGAPLVEVSPASGLGLGYYRNFINTTMQDILDERNSISVDGVPISRDMQTNARLEVWIPSLLIGAFQQNIKTKLITPGILIRAEIQIARAARAFPLYALPDISNGLVLVDIPTALNAMEVAIATRYSDVRLNRQSEEWLALEQQEIDRFRDTIQRLLNNEIDINIKEKVQIVTWDIK